MLHLHDIWYLFHRQWNLCPAMNKRQMCPLLSWHYLMSLLSPDICLVWMGQTFNMLLLVKCCSFSQKCDKVTKLIFALPTVYFLSYFSEWLHKRYVEITLGTKITFKAAEKLTPIQFCSKNMLNEVIFLKNGNFGTHAIVVSFLSCFSHEIRISFWWYITHIVPRIANYI